MQCRGFAMRTRERCRLPGVYENGQYCHHHVDQCRGYKLNRGKCFALRKADYNYCCADHDPVERAKYIAPSDFKILYLRDTMEDPVVQWCDQQDIYHHDELPRDLRPYHQMDHKFELQCGAFTVREANIEDREEQAVVKEFLRDEVLNEAANLCFTLTTTNKIKGSAVKKFLDDTRTGHVGDRTFTTYMLDADVDGVGLDRSVTGTIRKEMKKANKACQYKLEDESETPSFEAVGKQFKKLQIAMDS